MRFAWRALYALVLGISGWARSAAGWSWGWCGRCPRRPLPEQMRKTQQVNCAGKDDVDISRLHAHAHLPSRSSGILGGASLYAAFPVDLYSTRRKFQSQLELVRRFSNRNFGFNMFWRMPRVNKEKFLRILFLNALHLFSSHTKCDLSEHISQTLISDLAVTFSCRLLSLFCCLETEV